MVTEEIGYEMFDTKGKFCPILKDICLQDSCALRVRTATITEDGCDHTSTCVLGSIYFMLFDILYGEPQ